MAIRPRTTAQVLKEQAETSVPATDDTTPETLDAAQSSVAASHEMESLAISLSHEAGEKFDSDLDDVAEARETTTMGPLQCLLDLRADFGREKLAEFPRPGSTKADAGNHPYDKFTKDVMVDGERKPRAHTFYGVFHDSLPRGAPITERIHALEMRNKETNEFTTWHNEDATTELKKLKQRRTTRISTIRRAVNIERQCVAFETDLKGKVGFRFIMARDAKTGKLSTSELIATPYPIAVYDVDAPERPEVVSITTFLSYNVAAAAAKTGTVADLKSTVQRDSNKAGTGKDVKDGIPTVKAAEAWIAMLGHAFEDEAWLALLFKRMNSDKGMDIVRTLGDIYMELVPLYNDKDGRFIKRYRQSVGQQTSKAA